MRPRPSDQPGGEQPPEQRAERHARGPRAEPGTSPLVSRSTIRLSSPNGRLNEAGAGSSAPGRPLHRLRELLPATARPAGAARASGRPRSTGRRIATAPRSRPRLSRRPGLPVAVAAGSARSSGTRRRRPASQPVDHAVVAARPGEDVEPVGAVGGVGRLEADGGERLALGAGRTSVSVNVRAGVRHRA